MYTRGVHPVLLLVIYQLNKISVNSATFENVRLSFYNHDHINYCRNYPILSEILIQSDNTLVKYVTDQPYEIVKIENQKVPHLTSNSITDLPNILDIEITGSGVRTAQPGTFRNLASLIRLSLRDNLLDEVSDGVFEELPCLESLDLRNNKITNLGDKTFGRLPRLMRLFIRNNRISHWKNQWFVGTKVRYVDMAHNLLEELPANAFQYFATWQKSRPPLFHFLTLSHNQLKKIDQDAFRGLYLVDTIDLSHNRIQEVPSGVFRTVAYIKNVDLSHNEITKFDTEEIFRNVTVDHVILSNNHLECIRVDLVQVTVLSRWCVDGNPLTCECVESLRKWQNETERYVIPLDNIQEDCLRTDQSMEAHFDQQES